MHCTTWMEEEQRRKLPWIIPLLMIIVCKIIELSDSNVLFNWTLSYMENTLAIINLYHFMDSCILFDSNSKKYFISTGGNSHPLKPLNELIFFCSRSIGYLIRFRISAQTYFHSSCAFNSLSCIFTVKYVCKASILPLFIVIVDNQSNLNKIYCKVIYYTANCWEKFPRKLWWE